MILVRCMWLCASFQNHFLLQKSMLSNSILEDVAKHHGHDNNSISIGIST